MAELWALDPEITFLNHGSFGACPRAVLAEQARWRERLEREPVLFLDRELEGLLNEARVALGEFVGADPDDVAFLPNATSGVNTVLRALALRPGDEILVTDHEYNACLNAARFAAEASGAHVVVAHVPFPVDSPAQVFESIMSAVGPRTRIALVSHVTSPTAIIFPIAEIVRELEARDIQTLVDGAHAVGMLPLVLRALGASYYAGNCHKWLCAPKGTGFMHVRRDRQATIRPLVISHGANSPRMDRARYLLEFDWTGTLDPTGYLTLPAAINVVGSLRPGGWPQLMDENRRLCLAGRDVLCEAIAVTPPAPDEMLGSMSTLILGVAERPSAAGSTAPRDRLQDELFQRYRIEVPVWVWPRERSPGRVPMRMLRISAAAYNGIEQYERLAHAVVALERPVSSG